MVNFKNWYLLCLYIINLSYIRREKEPVFVLSACGENWYFFWRIYNRYRIVGRRKKNSLAGKDKAVLRNRFWVPNDDSSMSPASDLLQYVYHKMCVLSRKSFNFHFTIDE